jgi:hypothetical protein
VVPDKAQAGLRALLPAAVVMCTLLPLVLVAMYSRGAAAFLLATYTIRFQPWETFGAVVSVVGFAGVILTLLVRRRAGVSPVGPLIALAVALHLVSVLADYAEFSAESPTWLPHLAAIEAVARGPSPHALPPPAELPSVASLDVGFARLTRLAWRIGGTEPKPNEIATGVHYLWQCCQFFAIVGTLLLLSTLWRREREPDMTGWIATGGLIVLCFPLLRALRHDTVTPLVLAAGTAAVAHRSLRSGDWIAGLSLAVASYFTGYGVLLVLPFLVTRRWSVVWRFLFCIGVLLAPWALRGTLGLWGEGLRALWHRAVMEPPLDAGLQGTVRHALLRLGAGAAAPGVVGIADCMILAAAAWWIIRCVRSPGTRTGTDGEQRSRLALAGVLALLAVLMPTPWGGEYVFALPLTLLALQYGRAKPGLVAAGVLLTVVLPEVGLFLLRCHRLAGVALLLGAVAPGGQAPPGR